MAAILQTPPQEQGSCAEHAACALGVCDVVRSGGTLSKPHRPCGGPRSNKAHPPAAQPHRGTVSEAQRTVERTFPQNGSRLRVLRTAYQRMPCPAMVMWIGSTASCVLNAALSSSTLTMLRPIAHARLSALQANCWSA